MIARNPNTMAWELELEKQVRELAENLGPRQSDPRIRYYVLDLMRYGQCTAIARAFKVANDTLLRMPTPQALRALVETELSRTRSSVTMQKLEPMTPRERRASAQSAITTLVWMYLSQGARKEFFMSAAGSTFGRAAAHAWRIDGLGADMTAAEMVRAEILRHGWTKETIEAHMEQRFAEIDRADLEGGSV